MNILTTYMFIIIQLFTIKINIFVRIAFGTLKNLLQQNVHWPCSVPNKLMYHGKFPVEHARVRTRLLGTPEYDGIWSSPSRRLKKANPNKNDSCLKRIPSNWIKSTMVHICDLWMGLSLSETEKILLLMILTTRFFKRNASIHKNKKRYLHQRHLYRRLGAMSQWLYLSSANHFLSFLETQNLKAHCTYPFYLIERN